MTRGTTAVPITIEPYKAHIMYVSHQYLIMSMLSSGTTGSEKPSAELIISLIALHVHHADCKHHCICPIVSDMRLETKSAQSWLFTHCTAYWVWNHICISPHTRRQRSQCSQCRNCPDNSEMHTLLQRQNIHILLSWWYVHVDKAFLQYWASDVPTKALRTSLPGDTGLGGHTPSTCAGVCGFFVFWLL